MNKKRSKLVTLIAIICVVIVWIIAAVTTDADSVQSTFWALVPPIIAIALALVTNEVYSSLFIGILTGGLLYSGFHFEGTMNHIFSEGFITVLADSYNVGIIIFLVVLGIIVQLMNKTGGSAAFGNWASKHIKTRAGALCTTIALGCLIFIDDYFNCLTVGSVMRPVTDRHHVSRAKLSYIIDSTAAPVCIIAPISSWAAAVSSYVEGQNGMSLFIAAIPFNFYALFTIAMMFLLIGLNVDYGPMKVHEDNAVYNNDIFTTPDRPYGEGKDEDHGKNGHVADMLLPIIVLIAACVVGLIYTGGFFSGTSFVDSFVDCDASYGLTIGSAAALIIIIIYYLARRIISFSAIMECFPDGFKQMVPAMLILTFAWTLNTMTKSLGATDFVSNLVQGSASGLVTFLPVVIFFIAVGLSFSTGTSWGTFGMLIPIVVALFANLDQQMMVISISACMAGSVCGDHCSPISDTTIMSSAGGQCNHINHVSTQLPYAMTCMVIAAITYIIAGFTKSAVISIPCGIAMMVVFLLLMKRKGQKQASAQKANT